MNSREADALAEIVAAMVAAGDTFRAYRALQPVLEQKTPFRLLDRMATAAGPGPWPETIMFLDRIASDGRQGGWVIIGAFLGRQYPGRPAATISECR